jgi:hypothetical protein
METTVLSNMQKELLKLYSKGVPDEQLEEVKLILGNYFASKATEEMDRLWKENNWSNDTMKNWRNEHNRRKDSH